MNYIQLLADVGQSSTPGNFSALVFELFGGDYPVDPLKLHQIAARALAVFFVGLAIVRLGKSRLIARVTALDVIIGFLIGSLLGRGITGHASISGTSVACATVVFLHWLLSLLACRWHNFGRMIKGNTSLLVTDGQFNERAMLHSHISPHDVLEAARLKGLETVDEVRLAFKERNGEISILGRKKQPQIIEISVQEGVQTVRIEFN